MTTLSIGRLTATVPRLPGEPDLGPQVEGMLVGATGRPLDRALDARPLPAGHWFLRRLDLRLALDLRRAGPGTEQQWADAVALALHEAMLSGQALHYSSECDALADLVASAAVGRWDNEWAWRELGLVDGPVSGPAARAVLAACGRCPELALPATITAIRRAGTGAVHRMLDSPGWLELARLVYQVHTGRPAPAWLAAATGEAAGPGTAGGVTTDSRPELVPPGGLVPSDGLAPSGSLISPGRRASEVEASEIAGRIARVADGELARGFRRARLRPAPGVTLAWAVLAVAETEPVLLLLPVAESVARQLAAALLPGGGPPHWAAGGAAVARNAMTRPSRDMMGTDSGRPLLAAPSLAPDAMPTGETVAPDRPARPAGSDARTGDARPGPFGTPGQSDTPGPFGMPGPSDEPRAGRPSEWAGLLHLYQTAAEADVPAAVLADDALSARPLAWVLHSIAGSLVPAAPDDPALLAFAGLLPAAEPPSLAWRPAGPAELDSIARHARRWLTVTGLRLLGDGDATAQTTERLLHRSGIIFAERGWVDVQMPLNTVDIDIRRAGLDIDPGWLGWLGSVVRFCYV